MAVERTKLFDSIANGAAWDAGVVFNRTNGIPLDKFSVFETKELADDYALNNPVAYPGQLIAVVPEEGEATGYIILTDGTLKEIGATVDLTGYVTEEQLSDQIANMQISADQVLYATGYVENVVTEDDKDIEESAEEQEVNIFNKAEVSAQEAFETIVNFILNDLTTKHINHDNKGTLQPLDSIIDNYILDIDYNSIMFDAYAINQLVTYYLLDNEDYSLIDNDGNILVLSEII